VLVALVASQAAWAQQRLPVFDVKPECRAGGSVMPDQQCVADEQRARAELEGKWSSFTNGDRERCVGEATAGGSPSYVDLLTCLELAKEVRELDKK
jgi:hypothetical protein